MYTYMKKHQAFIENELKAHNPDLDWLVSYHQRQIAIIQHERLIHLLITLFFAFLFLCSSVGTLIAPSPALFLLDLILCILLLFYIRHYYRLENGLAYWYTLYEQIENQRRPH